MLGLAAPGQGTQQAEAAEQLPPHLRDLLVQVVEGLGAAARNASGAQPAAAPADEAAGMLGVLSPVEELDFWAQAAAGPAGE